MSLNDRKVAYEAMSDDEKAAHLKKLMGGMEIADHLVTLVKTRKLKIEGDDSHATVRHIKAVYANIDVPKKYDFQDDDVNEQMALRVIQFWSPYTVICDADAVIAGTAEVKGFVNDRVCYDCNKPLHMTLFGDTLTIAGDGPCQTNAVFDVKLHFPTGEIIAGDFPVGFREWFNHPLHKERMRDTYTAGLAGTRESTERWEKENVGHFFVGNTCPNVKLAKGGVISIRPDEKDEKGKKLTNICTDLWWTTLVDVEYWKKMMASIGMTPTEIDELYQHADTFKVKKGHYNFRYESNAGTDGDCRRVTGTRIDE